VKAGGRSLEGGRDGGGGGRDKTDEHDQSAQPKKVKQSKNDD